VRNSVYRFFAADGTELRLASEKKPQPSWAARLHPLLRSVVATDEERVVVTDQVIGHFSDELRLKLRRSLELVPEKKRRLSAGELAAAPLSQLANEFARVYLD